MEHLTQPQRNIGGYRIYDNIDHLYLAKIYTTRKPATARVDRLNAEYGCYRYYVEILWS